jgi:hypothetical protein
MKKKQLTENYINTKKKRKIAENYQAKRNLLMERTLLGLDDGTPDAAMNESLNFDKFEELWEDETNEMQRLKTLNESEEPAALQMLKRHRERISALKIRYNR